MLKTFSTSFNIVKNESLDNYTIPIFDAVHGQKMLDLRTNSKKRRKNITENTNLLLIFQGLFFILMVSKWGKVVPNGEKWCKPHGRGGEA